jgi:centrin-1
MTTKMSERDADRELNKAFVLFSNNKDHINLEDLKYIAEELGETMGDDELREMIFEANKKTGDGVVSINEFMSILEKPN